MKHLALLLWRGAWMVPGLLGLAVFVLCITMARGLTGATGVMERMADAIRGD